MPLSRRGIFGLIAGALAAPFVKAPTAGTAPALDMVQGVILDGALPATVTPAPALMSVWWPDHPNCRCVLLPDGPVHAGERVYVDPTTGIVSRPDWSAVDAG